MTLDNGMDRQADRQTDRQSASNMRPTPREKGRIIKGKIKTIYTS